MGNPRHPMLLQAELRAKKLALGESLEPAVAKPAPTPPPPPVAPKPTVAESPAPSTLSAKERLEALPDEALLEKAELLMLENVTADRDQLIADLLAAGVTG